MGFEAECFLEGGQRLLDVLQVVADAARLELKHDVLRIQGRGFLQVSTQLLLLAALLVQHREGQGGLELRLLLDDHEKLGFGGGPVLLQPVDVGQVGVGFDEVRRVEQDLLVLCLRGVELACLQELGGLVSPSARRRHSAPTWTRTACCIAASTRGSTTRT